MTCKTKKLQQFIALSILMVAGFILGRINTAPAKLAPVVQEIKSEKAEIKLLQITGDKLLVSLKGDIRVIWSDVNFLEEDGAIFLSQVPNTDDLKFREFTYTGNANTGKFYPSTTSWARGVRVKDRRFFQTKEEAIAAGFIPSKSVQ